VDGNKTPQSSDQWFKQKINAEIYKSAFSNPKTSSPCFVITPLESERSTTLVFETTRPCNNKKHNCLHHDMYPGTYKEPSTNITDTNTHNLLHHILRNGKEIWRAKTLHANMGVLSTLPYTMLNNTAPSHELTTKVAKDAVRVSPTV